MLAFEGAEGFGAQTAGGRGGVVVKVTNLNDSGEGSLRWALETLSGPRIVTFDVSGTIQLQSQILVQNPYVTIAGQTSPEGITLEGARIRFKAGEAIVQGLEFRPGDGAVGQDMADRDGLFIGTTDHLVKNIIIDHNSFSWATDENMTINGNVHNVTISNNIIAEGLSQSFNPKGEHSKGLLISNWGSTDPNYVANITVTKNLFAHNMDRNPEVRAGQNIEIINNYIYDPGKSDRVIAIGGGNSGTLDTSVAIIGNVVDAGLATVGTGAPVNLTAMGANSSVFLAGNTVVERPDATQSSLIKNTGGGGYVDQQQAFTGSGVTLLSTGALGEYVLANAGADPYARNAVDQRVVDSVRNGTGGLVNSPSELKVPTASSAKPAVDTDADGMADWFETRFGLDARVMDGNLDKDGDGYTNIEEYIQGLLTGFRMGEAKTISSVQATASADYFTAGAAASAPALAIRGFDAATDKLDLSGWLTAFTPASHTLTDYVEVVKAFGSVVVSVDRDGSGTAFATEFAVELTGLTSTAGVLGSIVTQAPPPPPPPPPPPVAEAQPTALLVASEPVLLVTAAPSVALPEPTLAGTSGIDSLRGTANVDVIDTGTGDDRLYGFAGNDYLFAGDGNDWLDGGLGDDLMWGGAGNDTYIIDSVHDIVSELTLDHRNAGGVDTVRATVSYTLGDHVEMLTLMGSAAIDGTGNGLDNTILGNSGANRLDGGAGADRLRGGDGNDYLHGGDGNDTLDGGLGADFLFGGDGNDTYLVNDLGDSVEEIHAAGGLDSVQSTISYSLTAHVERLTLTGSRASDGTGNGLDNLIVGNAQSNTLRGEGGVDTLRGGDGLDWLFGGDGNDILDGGAGDDWLAGGAGQDRLIGGIGRDQFLIGEGVDVISDFRIGDDRIALDDDIFLALRGSENHSLSSIDFVVGDRALTGDQNIIYNIKTGGLFYDADGAGGQAAFSIATLTRGLALTSDDFAIV